MHMRRFLRVALQLERFEVLDFADAREALQALTARGGDIAAIVSDVQMPFMDGVTFARTACTRFPAIPIVLMSGGSRPDLTGIPSVRGFFAKPFAADALVDSVRGGVRR